MKKRLGKICVVGLILAAALIAAIILSEQPRPRSVRLSNGVILSVITITHGPTNHLCFPQGFWAPLLHSVIPANGLKIGPLEIPPIRPLDQTSRYLDGRLAQTNKAVIWLRHRGPENAGPFAMDEDRWFNDIRAVVIDEAGEEWEMRPGHGRLVTTLPTSDKSIHGVTAWIFPSFPRRGAKIRFRLYARNQSDQWNTLAEFRIRNPDRNSFPRWQPASLPNHQTNGTVGVSLVSLVSGTRVIDYMPKDQRPYTEATFHVTENERATDAWLPDRMESRDATGNEGSFQFSSSHCTNGVCFYTAQGSSLSPSEVWRLRMRFRRQADFSPEDLWTSPACPVNGKVTARFQSYAVTIHASNGAISLRLDPTPAGKTLQLIEIYDDQGMPIARRGGSLEDNAFTSLVNLGQEIKTVRVKIVLAEMRFFEFVAQPASQ